MRIKKIRLLLGLLFASAIVAQAQEVEQAGAKGMKIYALRLGPGQDLRAALEKFTKQNQRGVLL